MTSRIRFILFSASSNFKVTTKLVFPESIRTGQEGDWNCGERTCDSDCCIHSESMHFSEGAAVCSTGSFVWRDFGHSVNEKLLGHVFAGMPFLHSPPWRASGLGYACGGCLVTQLHPTLCDPTACSAGLLCPWDFPDETTRVGCIKTFQVKSWPNPPAGTRGERREIWNSHSPVLGACQPAFCVAGHLAVQPGTARLSQSGTRKTLGKASGRLIKCQTEEMSHLLNITHESVFLMPE